MNYEKAVEILWDEYNAIAKALSKIQTEINNLQTPFTEIKSWIFVSTSIILISLFLGMFFIRKYFYKQKQEILALKKDNLILQKQILQILKENQNEEEKQ